MCVRVCVCVCVRARAYVCVCVCVCVRARAREERIQYHEYIIIISEVLNVYIYVDLVKRGVLSLDGVI